MLIKSDKVQPWMHPLDFWASSTGTFFKDLLSRYVTSGFKRRALNWSIDYSNKNENAKITIDKRGKRFTWVRNIVVQIQADDKIVILHNEKHEGFGKLKGMSQTGDKSSTTGKSKLGILRVSICSGSNKFWKTGIAF